ncbi:MAG: hypothetical protein L6R40_003104 [Gallowayella cf. fulva]|nr:MAG: hypothetical protein L6R40_003104 [Xanthomendoza cf. fulva]
MAPHVIVLDPLKAHNHRDLYHKMLDNERRILEKAERRQNQFPQGFAQRARRLVMPYDEEEEEAYTLLNRAKKHKLAANYKANVSSANLVKKRNKLRNHRY